MSQGKAVALIGRGGKVKPHFGGLLSEY